MKQTYIFDYGPCAFLDTYHPETVFSSIDEDGRYAYGNQPAMANWNLTRFAESLLPLLGSTQDEAVVVAVEILNTFPDLYQQAWLTGMHHKIGLQTEDTDSTELITLLLTWMEQTEADFTNTFRALASPDLLRTAPYNTDDFEAWHTRWLARRQSETSSVSEQIALMHRVNPDVIARNHFVEAALTAAETGSNFTPLHELLAVLKRPYVPRPDPSKYHDAAPPSAYIYQTFCGT